MAIQLETCCARVKWNRSTLLLLGGGGEGQVEPFAQFNEEYNNTALIKQISLFDAAKSHEKYLKLQFKIEKE